MSATYEPADVSRLREVLFAVAGGVALLWLIHTVFALTAWSPAALGVRPGEASGLVGVLTAPLVHGTWGHLAGNSAALLVLASAMIYGTPHAAKIALPVIWLASGLAVWLFAREAAHIGASGLTYGMMFFVFIIGILRRDKRSIALALLVFFLYGSMVWGLLPVAPGVSFEYHLFGALAGGLCAFLLRNRDPLPPRRRYEWEEEAEEEESGKDLVFDRPPPEDERRL